MNSSSSPKKSASLPPPVLPGDRVGVAAISGPVKPARLKAGLAALRGLGFDVVEASNLRSTHRVFAGDDAARLAGFHELAARDDISAIFFARGGWGALRLLPVMDWDLLARRPRAYVGYSDLTPFLLQVVQRLGWVAFHGPMVAADFARRLDEAERQSLLSALAGKLPVSFSGEGSAHGAGSVSGPLVGGCLSLLSSTLGTEWSADYDDAILFLEELHEPFYRFDRMLTQLRLSGRLTKIRGIVSGHLMCVGEAREGERHGGPDTHELLEELAEELGAPLLRCVDVGHDRPNRTLPLGLHARLDASRGLLICGSESTDNQH